MSQTTKMAWVYQEPTYTFPSDYSDKYLGEKVYEILSYSKQGIPHPEKLPDDTKDLLKAANVKSRKQLHEGSIGISVSFKGDNAILAPSVNMGSRKGFWHVKDLPPIELNREEFCANPEFAGKKIRECLLLCK